MYRGVLFLFAVLGGQLASTSYAQSTIVYLSTEEEHFYRALNQIRSNLSLPELKIHVDLQNAARKHSDWMASIDLLKHNGPTDEMTFDQRIEQEGYTRYSIVGENIACGSEDAISTLKQFALSKKHLENIINPRFRHIGIARAGNSDENCPFYWTNDFGSQNFSDANLTAPTDASEVTAALVNVLGSLGVDKVEMPNQDVAVGTPTPSPMIPIQTPTPSPLPSVAKGPFMRCQIPSSLGLGTFTDLQNVDSTIDAQASSGIAATIKVTYSQEGKPLPYSPVLIYGASLVKSSDYPLMVVTSAPGTRIGGFTILLNLSTSQAQFFPFAAGAKSGVISCTAGD